ncbi:MAG: hypothetical protein OHK0017_01890 [Patescibacteria group bacterium]
MFLDMCREGKELESSLNSSLEPVLQNYDRNATFISTPNLLGHLKTQATTALKVETVRISGVLLEKINYRSKLPDRTNLKPKLAESLNAFGAYFPKILQVTQIKHNTQKIAKEILKTNRQIANLENRIEEIEQNIKFINNSINERLNFEKAVLINIFGD